MRARFILAVWAMGMLSGVFSTVASAQVVPESEPNDTPAQADTHSAVVGLTHILGNVASSTDVDVFRVSEAAGRVWRFEIFFTVGTESGMRLALLDAAGTTIILDSVGMGLDGYPEITAYLNPGTYYVRVDRPSGASGYRLDCTPLTDAGAENETAANMGVNDTINTPTTLFATSVFIFGGHMVQGDSDFYSFEVPEGAAVRIELIEGNRAVATCESNQIASRLTLYSPSGMLLVDDDNDGRGFCSLIDGAGGAPRDYGARGLSSGTYYVQVRASQFATPTTGRFDYRLAVMIYLGSGACCNPATGGCAVVSPDPCFSLGLQFQGDQTTCGPNPCTAATGACCTGTACAQATSAACAGAGHVFQGVGVACVARFTCCPANFNRNGTLEVQDIFDFLQAWFAGCP